MSDQTKPTRRTGKKSGSNTNAQNNKAHVDELLDEALDETFPASDPPALTEPSGGVPASRGDEDPQSDEEDAPDPTAKAIAADPADFAQHPERSARKSTMQTQDATPEFPVVMPGCELLSIATYDMFRTMSDWTAETGGFLGQRLEKDAQLMSTLARCEGVFDATHCLTRFFSTAFEDYAVEAQRINTTMGRNMMKAFGDVQEQFSEPKAPAID